MGTKGGAVAAAFSLVFGGDDGSYHFGARGFRGVRSLCLVGFGAKGKMMRRHLVGKAAVLLVVAMFHAFVLVPRSHANVVPFPGAAARMLIRAVGFGVNPGATVLYVVAAAVTGYLVYKSLAVSAVKSWQSEAQSPYPWPGTDTNVGMVVVGGWAEGSWVVYCQTQESGGTWRYFDGWAQKGGQNLYGGNKQSSGYIYASSDLARKAWHDYLNNYMVTAQGATSAHYNVSYVPSNNDPYDPGVIPNEDAPTFPAASVYMSPGLAAGFDGSESVQVVASGISDSAAQDFIDAGKLIEVDPDDGSLGEPSTASEVDLLTALNAILDDSRQQSRESTQQEVLGKLGEIKTGLDNATGGSFPQEAQDALDDISLKMDNVAVGLESVEDALTETTATEQTLSTRFAAVRDLALTKFPFSLVGSYNVTVPSGGNYDLGGWELVNGNAATMVNIAPLSGPLGATFLWIRQLLVYMLWALTGFGMIKRVTNL